MPAYELQFFHYCLTNSMSFLLIIALGFRVMNDLKINEDFGFLAQLIESCLVDVLTYTVFFVMWVCIFTVLFSVLHLDVGEESVFNDNHFTNETFRLVMWTYFNSIGVASLP